MILAERVQVLRAMETIARCVNDEEVFCDIWLSDGIPDGEIDESTSDEELQYLAESRNFSEIMSAFLQLMVRAKKSGGLFCDGVFSDILR